jgi:hypothetical protein
LGNIEQALYSAEQALFLGIEDSAPEYIGAAWRALGMVAMRTGIPVKFKDRGSDQVEEYDAEACFRKSERIFSETDMDGERARTLREWARHDFKIGNQEEGEKKWQEARAIFTRLGADLEVERLAKPPA